MSQQNDEYKPSDEFGGDYFTEGGPREEQILDEADMGPPKQDFSHFAEELAGGGGKPAILRIITDRRFYLPLGLIVMVYIVYLFMSGGSAKEDTPKQDAQQQAVAAQQARAAAAESQLSNVAQLSRQNQTQIKALTSSIQQLQATQANLNNELTRLGNSMSDLSFIVQKMVEQQKAKKKVVKKKVVKKPTVVRVNYHLRAVVPGRAWLEQPGGATLTVAVGDTLTGYGTITNIDTTQGVVYTSSGARIGYQPHYSRP